LDPDPDPDLPPGPPMLGHGSFPCVPGLGAPDLCCGAGAEGVDEVDGLVVELVLAVLDALGAAAAPAMPAAAPPAARAPVTIVAPSSLEMVISSDPLRSVDWPVRTIVGDEPKRARSAA
jgi:hypothetical protein